MDKSRHSVRVVQDDDTNYTGEAVLVQRRAAARQASVIRLGAIVFFSTATGDAWMLDVDDETATRLACDGVPDPIPIHETETRFAIEWQATYRIDREVFTVTEGDGRIRAIVGYPTVEIERLIDDYPAQASPAFFNIEAIRTRLKETGRNDPCPCGSGKKYKKCCQPRDEELVRQRAIDRAASPVQRAEFDPGISDENDDDTPTEDDEVIEINAESGDAEGDEIDPTRDAAPAESGEPALASEVERTVDTLWAEFDRLKHPTTGQMDAHLTRLLALPPEATSWTDLFQDFARHQHADLPGVFRRVATAVPATKATALSFFYWSAIEKFISAGRLDLLPEVVAHFCTLNRETYDADALDQAGLWLMAAECETAALKLAEHFLPVMRSDDLMPYAVPDACHMIFELRVGARLRQTIAPGADPAVVARELRREIEAEVDADVAHRVATVIRGGVPSSEFTPRDFDLPLGDSAVNEVTWERSLHCVETFARVAREAWQVKQRPPGIGFRGLWRLMNVVCREHAKASSRSRKSRRNTGGNLLACLQPRGLERRVAENSRGMLGTNPPQAHLMLEAHATLLGFARRHALIEADLAAQTERQLLQLKTEVAFPG